MPSRVRSVGAVSVIMAVLLLPGCGGSGSGSGAGPRPSLSVSPTRSLPSPTRSPDRTSEPTEAPTDQTSATGTARPSPTAEPTTPKPSQSPTQAPTTTQPSPTPTQSSSQPAPVGTTSVAPTPDATPTGSAAGSASSAASDDTADDGVPGWVWWLVAALVVIGAVVAGILIARARRRSAWQARLAAAETEMAWLARELLPQLRDTGSLEGVAGGWRVALPRVTALDDELTVLESSAGNTDDAGAAASDRDVVRTTRATVDSLTAGGPHDTWALDLDDAIARIESTLAPTPPPPPS